ncbi:MAG: hypothetical protein ArsCj_1290 [Arsenophonus endosymbiont of Ceratovacuna japonica]
MNIAAQLLIGEKDFTSFRSINCQSKSPWRDIKYIYVKRYGDYILIDIKANSFLYHMVRNIIGSLLEVGCGNKNINWISEILEAKDRQKSYSTAKADGLYLIKVYYPKIYKLPKNTIKPFILPI